MDFFNHTKGFSFDINPRELLFKPGHFCYFIRTPKAAIVSTQSLKFCRHDTVIFQS